jgi:hypothetical protein
MTKRNTEIENINTYDDFITYIVKKAIDNVIKYSTYTKEEVYSFHRFEDFAYKISSNYHFPTKEHYNDILWLRSELKRDYIKIVRSVEYDIYYMI